MIILCQGFLLKKGRNMQNWYERFKEIRKKHRLSQSEIGRIMGKDATQVSRYERGAVKNFPNSLYKLLNGTFDEWEISYIENGLTNKMDDACTHAIDKNIATPYYKNVYASAGGGSNATDMSEASPITFSKEFLTTYLGIRDFRGISIINAAGDSMQETIRSGALMFVCPMENESFKDGGIYVLMCCDALLVKRVYFNPVTKEYTLSSDSESVDDIVMNINESSECRFVGRVVGHLDRV